ncbi:hypothetical protein AOQ84DRAFT_376031 [Glonium stellatum]|uniref:Uncharacterized protein n=1 Tax=Glonium stellatum TaxID=574774 RepID=A0A8E2F2F5_9PEZI|nr:hypothetical protein AOQ84DRAFT_376031 [Glonium stellatum]
MPNYSQYDEDEYRLPENMTRIGYDADAQVYSYRDACGKLHQGAPGNRYDVLRPVTDEPHYPTAASYLEAHKEHHNSSSSSSSPMTASPSQHTSTEFCLQPQEFPDTWDVPNKDALSKLITDPVCSLQRSFTSASRHFSQASALTPTERQGGRAEKLNASPPTSPVSSTPNAPAQSLKRALTLGRRLTQRKPARYGRRA